MANPQGFDLSSNNGPVDWPTLAAHLLPISPEAFPIIKVSQGDWYVNPLLDQQRNGAHAAGFKTVGLYHYFEAVASSGPNTGKGLSGADNATFFLDTIARHGGLQRLEFLAVDWESDFQISPTADLGAAQVDLIGNLKAATGLDILEYSAPYYAIPHKLVIPPERYWQAAPSATTPPNCLIWQYSWSGQLPGISTPVDLNAIVPSITQLNPFRKA